MGPCPTQAGPGSLYEVWPHLSEIYGFFGFFGFSYGFFGFLEGCLWFFWFFWFFEWFWLIQMPLCRVYASVWGRSSLSLPASGQQMLNLWAGPRDHQDIHAA